METTTTDRLPERYADAELVARGGMGEVWRATDTLLNRPVAVKLLRDSAGNEPPETLRLRFQREAQAIARLSSHPRIVTVFDVGETAGGVPYMTMQWLGGGTLPVDRTAADWSDRAAVRWLAQAASGLDAAHLANIVHRDVKPSNILLDEEGDAYIGDFGIAQVQQGVAGALTQTGTLIGTASYMSPEQATGDGVEAASDQYALASIAYEMLVGVRPFPRESPLAELAAHVSEPPPTPSLQRPGLPPAVDAVFLRALAKQPDERYLTCGAFVEELQAALAQSAPIAAPAEPTRPQPMRPRPQPTRRRQRRSHALLPLAAVLAIAGVGGITLALTTGDREPPTEQAKVEDATPATTTPATTAPAATTPATTAPATTPPATTTPAAAADAGPQDAPQAAPRAPTPTSTSAAIAQHLRSFRLLQQRRYSEALAEGTASLARLGGVKPYEAFANYNVGASLVGLGRCAEALPYLDRSEQLQGSRAEIRAARNTCSRG
ncbi:MAG: pknB [Thermoleophilia bacterium]|nr:pknB [Thermoleophilia bacterium]